MRNPALDAWGDYDRDDPYPLFAEVQADGPVHEVTLADGHRAWLIVCHEEAKAALGHASMSKDMHAALARDGAVVAEGLPGPAFARHMLSVDPPDHTRLRRLASAAFSRPRMTALRPHVQAIVDRLLDDLEAPGDPVVDLGQGLAFSLPFTVVSELYGVPDPDPALVPHAIEEILRWDAPVPHSTFRYTTQDVALGGTVIPAFNQVIISLAAANRDPARYDNPETLDVTRADTSHLAFGHGIHHC